MDIFSELPNSDSFNPTKKSISSKIRKMRISWFKNSFSRRSKETQMSEKRFRLTKVYWSSLYFVSKKIANFCCFTSTICMEIFNSVLIRFLTISMRFIIRISKKKYQRHSHYLQTGFEKKNHKTDQNVYNVNKYYYLVRRCTIFQNGRE